MFAYLFDFFFFLIIEFIQKFIVDMNNCIYTVGLCDDKKALSKYGILTILCHDSKSACIKKMD